MTDSRNKDLHTDPEELILEIEETEKEISSLHNDLLNGNLVTGFALEAIKSAKDSYQLLVENLNKYEEVRPVIDSGFHQVKAIKDGIEDLRKSLRYPLQDLRGMAESVYITCATSGSVAGTIDYASTSLPELPSFMVSEENNVIKKMELLDPSLAQTYRSVDEVYYATNADNIRASLVAARQVFDHFFGKLAPDEEVRKSRFWKRKVGGSNEELVTRRERIQYAIDKYVSNRYRATMLLRDIDVILQAYNGLNALHKRGCVNVKAAKQALFLVKHYINDFTEAMDLP